MKSICTLCIHHIHDVQNTMAPNVWYNHFCGASPRLPATDPVTGEEGFIGKNDLGHSYVSSQKFDYCRNVNKGSCVQFRDLLQFQEKEGGK